MLITNSISLSSFLFLGVILTLLNKVLAAGIPFSSDEAKPLAIYPKQPNEILPIQPVLLYPKARQLKQQARKIEKDNEIIYVQLLKRKNYRPKKRLDDNENITSPPKEQTMKDIFYVKALANGQFSHQRLKWYRLPEFYAISVYRKGELQNSV